MREDLQIAAVAALVAAPTVVATVGDSSAGPAVFAAHQDFPDVYPRHTIEPAQRLGAALQCAPGRAVLYLTLHSWAQGPAASLEAARAADAAIAVLTAPLAVPGFRVTAQVLESSRPVGDPNPAIEHIVSVFRLVLQPTE